MVKLAINKGVIIIDMVTYLDTTTAEVDVAEDFCERRFEKF